MPAHPSLTRARAHPYTSPLPTFFLRRKSFLSLFTRKALSTYVELQDGIIRRHIEKWLKNPEEVEIRDFIRCGRRILC